MSNIDIKKCYKLLKDNDIWDDDYDVLRKKFKVFALKNHPDKGGVEEIFKAVSTCKDTLDDDFEYFKNVAVNDYVYNEEQVIYDNEYDFDDSNDEDYNPNVKSKKKQSKTKKSKQHTHVDFETFIKKECKGGKGGWLVTELRNFCNILGLKHTGSKSELCKRLNDYFKRKDSINLEIDKELKEKQEERRNYEDELKQKDLLEKVYKEQQRIRQEELDILNERMSALKI